MMSGIQQLKISDIKYAFFDFDNTIYPGLLLYDISIDYFTRLNLNDKAKKLDSVMASFKKGYFHEASKNFAKLIEGEPCGEFYRRIDYYLNRIPLKAKTFVNALTAKGCSCYLVSLTSDIIASKVSESLGFTDWLAIQYGHYNKKNFDFFDGSFFPEVKDSLAFKASCFSKFNVLNSYDCSLAVGDSLEDTSLLKNCKYNLFVGTNKTLAEKFPSSLKIKLDWSDFAWIL